MTDAPRPTSRTNAATLRTRQIVVWHAQDTFVDKVVNVLSILMSIIAYVALIAWLDLFSFPADRPLMLGVLYLALALVVACTPTLLWIGLGHHFTRRRIRRRRGRRYERLCRVVEHPQAAARAPHRVLEHAMYASFRPHKVIRRFAKRLPPGFAIIARPPKAPAAPSVGPCDMSFEPIDIDRDAEQLMWLLHRSDPESRAKMDDGTFDPVQAELDSVDANAQGDATDVAPQGFSWRRIVRHIITIPVGLIMLALVLVVTLAPIVLPGWLIYRAVRNPSPGNLLWAALFCALLAGGALFDVFRRRRFFLIPGGVAVQSINLIGRTKRVERLTTENASLLIVAQPEQAMLVVDGRRVIPFRTDWHLQAALLAAWQCPAPPPSQAQLTLLLDPRRG
ncbi:MAG TPA: hypothetical protein P5081_01290 [Phycisphaerae bacterium]|nr:hypothetical protein [Phycisphaerae bacterium]HRW51488.1 hypothetical protein [Phycisphaerae bacterium]